MKAPETHTAMVCTIHCKSICSRAALQMVLVQVPTCDNVLCKKRSGHMRVAVSLSNSQIYSYLLGVLRLFNVAIVYLHWEYSCYFLNNFWYKQDRIKNIVKLIKCHRRLKHIFRSHCEEDTALWRFLIHFIWRSHLTSSFSH